MADKIKFKIQKILTEGVYIAEGFKMDITIKSHGAKLLERLSQDSSFETIFPNVTLDDSNLPNIINEGFVKYDPTDHKEYVSWIISTYNKGGIRLLEDVGKVSEPLAIFHKFKRTPRIEQNDIGRYKSLNELFAITDPLSGEKTSNEVKKEELKTLTKNGDITILLNNAKYRVAIPHTIDGENALGREAKWCTVSKDGDATIFNSYNQKGDLYIILIKGRRENSRFQFHWSEQQFMDELDDPINLYQFFTEHKELLKIPYFNEHFKFTKDGYMMNQPWPRGEGPK